MHVSCTKNQNGTITIGFINHPSQCFFYRKSKHFMNQSFSYSIFEGGRCLCDWTSTVKCWHLTKNHSFFVLKNQFGWHFVILLIWILNIIGGYGRREACWFSLPIYWDGINLPRCFTCKNEQKKSRQESKPNHFDVQIEVAMNEKSQHVLLNTTIKILRKRLYIN